MQNIASDIPTADELGDMADRGEDISRFFTNAGTMQHSVKLMQIEFPGDMLHELDIPACELHVNVQSVIITYLRQALDQHYLANSHLKKVAHQ